MRRYFIAAGILVLVFAILFGLFQLSKARGYQLFGKIIPRVETAQPVVALTLDDGPTLRYTRDVLNILNDRDVKATFFLTGREIEETPALAAEIVRRGHQIGNHSYSHSDMTLMSTGKIRDEIERTDKAIRNAGYQGEIYFRPPYGKKLITLPWYLSQTGRTSITWDVEPESYADIAEDADAMAKHVIENARNGSIILLHVMYRSREASRQALPKVIDGLKARGFQFVTVSDLISRSSD
ncbi:polysaccharide deacetylase family protein [Agrobacterium larrymoorei]|uniref:Chitooligosaccharide deacetylase n=1 Tax=Agrobacterium larrymoorei TaxID=160699 RepID=A0A4D7DNJ0_9HYPH|nr:polysaccharide deacetylase family protein [Agrobacterium larrymoorei]QCI97688.1 polysaccharide deacetylase [Agrobacterium larrymoorei]QYA06867.1 polysaccharide deacetylase family protein [Agrobacterium larrymoorei]